MKIKLFIPTKLRKVLSANGCKIGDVIRMIETKITRLERHLVDMIETTITRLERHLW